MFESFASPAPDTIVELMQLYRADPRLTKKDLGIGVYKDAEGQTPIMRAVKLAERRYQESETSKAYLGLQGDEVFSGYIRDLVLDGVIPNDRVRSIQTVGGGAALRLLCDMLADNPGTGNYWVPTPTWINHIPIAKAAGLSVKEYAYYDPVSGGVNFDRMVDSLGSAGRGDIILLHACCHNPTGADLSTEQWTVLSDLINKRGLLPLVDVAYQGFGEGLSEDVKGVRILAARVPEMAISTSCSKNFGVYRDRVGTATIIAADGRAADKARAVLLSKGRVNYSFPPNHGAATVSTIFSDVALLDDWKSELVTMRIRLQRNRQTLVDELRRASNSDRFDFITSHRGMFSLLGLSRDQILRLRDEFAIFMPPDGRINIAAVNESDVQLIGKGISSVL